MTFGVKVVQSHSEPNRWPALDMSGGGKGVSSALVLSNAITNLSELEPMSGKRKERWKKEISWLLSVTDYIVEFVPSQHKTKDGSNMESDEWLEERKGRISKVFDKNEVSISTYDTAWVAMVPSPFSSGEPCFPDSLYWLLENQCHDGSWARPHHHSLLKKDVLSSTLACILALKKWGVGQQHINKGLDFLEENFGSARDETQISPMGFEILFPAMLDLARGLSLNFSLDQTTLNDLMNMRDLELKRCCESESRGMEAYLAYIGEGMGKTLQEWESVVKKYQRKNGSLFNSPSTTSAAFIALGNTDCLKYLHSLVNTFGSAVPAVYPVDIYSQLCTVDNLERLGISRFFMKEIQSVLDQTYRCWVRGDEDIFMDASTCALAFRILRMNGYNVTSDPILHPSCVHGHMINVTTTLELYRASQLTLYPHETQLEEQKLRLRSKLEQELSSGSIQSPQLNAEVKQALDYPIYTIMDRMAKRKAIENYNIDNTRILKTSYCLANLGNKDFLRLSVEDYNQCQAIYREESREFDRWLVESRLNEVESARRRSASIAYCYSTAAAALFGPQVWDARMSWAKNSVLTTLLDDLFDVDGSVEDVRKLIHMVELWDVDVSTECCSHDVGILFSALKSTICEIADKGSKLQGRCIKSHIIAIWLDLLYASKQEVEWRENKSVPTLDEYMSTTFVSFALGPIVLPLLYLIGPKISQEMVNHSDYHNLLYKLMSTIGRLFNDIRGYEREREEGKVCAVPMYIAEKGGEMSAEAAISEIESVIDSQTKELLRLVLEKEKEKESSSALPRSCKELFWNMCSVLHLLYNKVDGFRSRDFLQVLDNIIHQPIVIEEF